MFGVSYSRKKFWIVSIFLFILNTIINIIIIATDGATILYGFMIAVIFIWINTLANRIRDYGSNPFFSLLALLPLVNIILACYYGIKKYTMNTQ